ncbi:threonine ammonia-lyase [Catelliglobosispora koreensis]|uniref:threonine ammonia-lyase n=1 Tax=Catelliglobosispora koreensis TaxID=129052 RepID=UPI0003704A77|nr:threonine/serine dehydratase [Catelliglobosispora koreensis]
MITLKDVQDAAERIRGIAMWTPLLPFGEGLWLKPETLQSIGAFKVRGGVNAVSALKPKAVVTHSSGNHGQAIALAAKTFGIPATIVVPSTTPAGKMEALRRSGAAIVVVEPADRLSRAESIAAEQDAVLIPPFDHPLVIAGQGTIALEILHDLSDVDVIATPVGGGGLISGIAVAAKALKPSVKVIGVEPELAGETAESFRHGELVTWPIEKTYQTIADGVRTAPSPLTFEHIQAYVDDVVTVSEEDICAAMGDLALNARLVVEPSGALAVAAHRSGLLPKGRTVAVLSGGNVDPSLLRTCLT